MRQIDMIKAQLTIEDTEDMLQQICNYRMNGGCGKGMKDRCFSMVMCDKCHRCLVQMTAEEHKKELLRG